MTVTLFLLVLVYSFALWLGLYLLQRDWQEGYLRMAGLGLVSYAAALGLNALALQATGGTAIIFGALHQFLIYQPALLWAGGLLHLLPGESGSRRRLLDFYYSGQLLITELLLGFHLVGAFPSWTAALVVGAPIFVYLVVLIREHRKAQTRARLRLALVGTVFFGLSMGLLVPVSFIPYSWLVLMVGLDLAVLGVGIAVHDAFQEGHALRRSMWHSFQGALFACLLLGGQVGLAMLGLGTNLATTGLLLGLLGTGIFLVVVAPFQRSSRESAAIESAARNLGPEMDFSAISLEDFTRYTRRAISYLDDLPKLASSPLIRLPSVAVRLEEGDGYSDTLSQAAALRRILIENITRLKPEPERDFGTTDAWRYYNAVYFPYVVGLKPSKRRQTKTGLANHEAEALAWFRREVPERTLYNWQTKAAELIAKSLWEQNQNAV